MPIKPENRNRYPDNWPDIRAKIRERAGDKCEWCGVVNHSYIHRLTRELCLPDEDGAIKIICTVAHLDHTPENCDNENLAFLCQRCYNRYYMKHRQETRRKARLKGQFKLKF
ncbi:hypothetical protein [Anaerophaga thermohalophila]|jgi:5-methylcytosine-specific restriction endonuclease McrA|uniref:hypothetical protein n=1 Tax=Anaerophaga thermohalophila TaxID=177400 RepID=UPI0009DA2573|nr:hypothetical protein [Anaerophaga thermohalophila]